MSTTGSHWFAPCVCLFVNWPSNRHSFSFDFITPIFSQLRNAEPSCKHNLKGRVDWQASIYQHTLMVGPF